MPILLKGGGRHDAAAATAVEQMIGAGYIPEYNRSKTAYRWRNAQTGDVYMGDDLGGLGVSEGIFTKKRGLKRAIGRMVGNYYSAGLFPEAEYLNVEKDPGEEGAEGAADTEGGGTTSTTVTNNSTTGFGARPGWGGYGGYDPGWGGVPYVPNPNLTPRKEEEVVEEEEEVEETTTPTIPSGGTPTESGELGESPQPRPGASPEEMTHYIRQLEAYLEAHPELGEDDRAGIQAQIDEATSERNWGFPVWSFGNWFFDDWLYDDSKEGAE